MVEAFVPTWLHRLEKGQYLFTERVETDSVTLDTGRHDPVNQRLEENHVTLSRDGTHFAPIECRYAWPSELDLMARIAGLRLKERWSNWEKAPFTAESRNGISVYGR